MSEKKIRNIFNDGPISPEFIAKSIAAHQSKTAIGGHSIFMGQVRADIIDDKVVEAIEYTSYQDLALGEMHKIREEIFAKYELECMHVHHSLGIVKTGEICLFVFTSSKHRKTAIEACAELVERIKKELPVWGREIFSGTAAGHQWKKNN